MNRYRSGALALGVPPAKIWLPCSVSRLKLNPSPKAPRPTLSATHPWFKPPPPEAPYCQLQCRDAPANVQTAAGVAKATPLQRLKESAWLRNQSPLFGLGRVSVRVKACTQLRVRVRGRLVVVWNGISWISRVE